MTHSELFICQEHDIDRIHSIVTRTEHEAMNLPKFSGRTYATLMLMLGELYSGDRGNSYLYVGNDETETENAKHEFKLILEHEGYKATVSQTRLFVGDENNSVQSFWFLPANEKLAAWARGWKFSQIFLDVSSDVYDTFAKEITLTLQQEKSYGNQNPNEPD